MIKRMGCPMELSVMTVVVPIRWEYSNAFRSDHLTLVRGQKEISWGCSIRRPNYWSCGTLCNQREP
jgi:hypothetical protein